MNKKKFLIVAILFVICLLGCSLWLITQKTSFLISKKHTPKLLLDECCASGEKYCKLTNLAGGVICPDDYEKKCKELGGSILNRDVPATLLLSSFCYETAPDVGKACAKDSECFYNCDLYNGVLKNLCNLNKIDKSNNTTETYNCSTRKPGTCSPTPIDNNNCGGPKFELNGKKLRIIYNYSSC